MAMTTISPVDRCRFSDYAFSSALSCMMPDSKDSRSFWVKIALLCARKRLSCPERSGCAGRAKTSGRALEKGLSTAINVSEMLAARPGRTLPLQRLRGLRRFEIHDNGCVAREGLHIQRRADHVPTLAHRKLE